MIAVEIVVVNCRWLSVRLEMLGICIVFGAALFVSVLLPRNAGLAGLALTSALNLTGQHLLACAMWSPMWSLSHCGLHLCINCTLSSAAHLCMSKTRSWWKAFL